jgi:DNA-binding winged helix-turn-helix (wHTH) protein
MTQESAGCGLRFHSNGWVVDTTTRQVTRGRRLLHLSPKAFELLTTLIAERPAALSKADLQRRLWPDTFVSEANLAVLVAEIRSALDDRARAPRYVRTVHRFGYAFCGKLREENQPRTTSPQLPGGVRLLLGTREVSLGPGEHVLGRTQEAALWIDSPDVSRRHARIAVREDGAAIEDLGSKNGTYVNGTRVREPCRLADGDAIHLGSVRVVFRAFSPPPSTATEAGGRAE